MTERKFDIKPTGMPDYPVMMLAVIRALKELGGLATKHDIEKQIIKSNNVSDKKQSYLQKSRTGTRTRLDFALTIARSSLKRNGALEKLTKGFWKLTESGWQADDLGMLDSLYKESERIRRLESQNKKPNKIKQKAKTDDKSVNLPVEEDELDDSLEDDWKFTLIDTLKSMNGYAFERLCQRLLSEAGFVEVNVNEKKGGDDGIDGTGILRINLISFKVYFQCKRWEKKHSVPPKEIRDFRGALDSSVDKGLFITTSSFSQKAKEESEMKGKLLIDLIDGDRLCDLLKENNLGIYTDPDGEIIINHKWFDRFNIEPPKTKKPKTITNQRNPK